MKLIITRHGETYDNLTRTIQGHSHGKLTDKGIEQAYKLGAYIKDKIDFIYCSDLNRAKETAAEILKSHPESKIIYDRRIRERDYGICQGKRADTIDWPSIEKINDINVIEPLINLRERLSEFYTDILKKHMNDTVLVVSHGTACRIFLGLIQGKSIEESMEQKIENTSISVFEISPDMHCKMHILNGTNHL